MGNSGGKRVCVAKMGKGMPAYIQLKNIQNGIVLLGARQANKTENKTYPKKRNENAHFIFFSFFKKMLENNCIS